MTKVFWLFGRSAAGKTTLATRLRNGLTDRGVPVFFLDGEAMRSGLCSDLGFTTEARIENHRRIAEVANLAVEQGMNVIAATMAPQHAQRDIIAKVLGPRLVWFYIHAPLNTCIERDPKGLYRRAQEGKLDRLLDFPFEAPRAHERENFVDTVAQNIEGCYESILEVVQQHLVEYAI